MSTRAGIAIALLSLALGTLGGYWGGRMAVSIAGQPQPAAGAGRPGRVVRVTRTQVLTSSDAIVQAVKKMTPSVVKIRTLRAPTMDELFWQLFSGALRPRPVEGIGSGFIFEHRGRRYVMTNTHVVADALVVKVDLTDGRTFDGKVLAKDPNTDVAVVELVGAPADLQPASLGDSDRVEVGEWVIAMGNPFGYDNTVTVGVVSAVGYRPVGEGVRRKVIQTDAAINAGNSGGPLVDLGGNVIGINYKIFTTTGATVGIGFAIPINEAKQIVKLLVDGGPWIGLWGLIPNSRGLQAHLGLPTDRGVVVYGVDPRGPAAQAGLKEGDIILEVDGKPVSHVDEVRSAVLAHNIGDTIVFKVQRGQQILTVRVQAGRVPEGYFGTRG